MSYLREPPDHACPGEGCHYCARRAEAASVHLMCEGFDPDDYAPDYKRQPYCHLCQEVPVEVPGQVCHRCMPEEVR